MWHRAESIEQRAEGRAKFLVPELVDGMDEGKLPPVQTAKMNLLPTVIL
jgi:hypothetical protein